jgi:phage terminase large subunit
VLSKSALSKPRRGKKTKPTILALVPEVFEPLFKKRARYKGAHGGRGSGKSHSFAALAVIRGAETPMRILCCREFQYSIDESVKHIVEQKIHDLQFTSRLRSSKTYTAITFPDGRETLFIYEGLHANTSAIRSVENIDIAWIDEAQTITQRSLDDLIPTIRKDGSALVLLEPA